VTTKAPRILVVEDDPSIRELYATLLQDGGYSVAMAGDGQDGLDQLGCDPDLIILDLLMPLMDGRQFLGRLRGLAGHRRTPVLVVSAVSAGTTVDGAQAVVQKPFDTDALLRRVSDLLRLN
jgi:DNA-binding response OmpR family regulator